MKMHWVLRDELYGMLHRWPSMIAFLILGSLIGYISSFVWPSFYRASNQIYVGLNPYRTYSDTNFLSLAKPRYANIDNYMYWQMYQLQTAIYLEGFIQETLDRLIETDSYWSKYDRSELLNMLNAEWRTAGEWTLSAEHPESDRAEQAVQTWSNVVRENTKEAIRAARETFIIDHQLQVLSEELFTLQHRQQELVQTKNSLLEWSKAAQALPGDQLLGYSERWKLLYLTTHMADFSPPWQALLQEQPPENSLNSQYQDWIKKTVSLIDTELSELPQLITGLQNKHDQLETQYNLEADNSLSLSPNLEIKEIRNLPTRIIQPTSILILIGGAVGLFIWILTQLIIITNRVKDD